MLLTFSQHFYFCIKKLFVQRLYIKKLFVQRLYIKKLFVQRLYIKKLFVQRLQSYASLCTGENTSQLCCVIMAMFVVIKQYVDSTGNFQAIVCIL